MFRRRFRRKRKFGRRFRRRRRVNNRRRALARVQNLARFTSKCYQFLRLKWYADPNKKAAPGVDNAERFTFPIHIGQFTTENQQFKSNLGEYHFIKFNYFAIKFCEVSYFGFQMPEKYDNQFVGLGLTAAQTQNYPMYVVWDIEDDLGFGTGDGNVDINGLSQYFLTKTIRPSSKKGVSFVYKVPMVWRQFFSTYQLPTYGQDIGSFFYALSGIKNVRYPKKIYGGHVDWWTDSLPHADTAGTTLGNACGYTGLGIKFYLGVTFRGRKIMGGATKAVNSLSDLSVEYEIAPPQTDVNTRAPGAHEN